jgi:hypothetical protein
MEGRMSHDALAMVEYRDEPSVLIFGDNVAAIERATATARSAECRVPLAAPVAETAERLAQHAGPAALFVELQNSDEEDVLRTLDLVQAQACSGRPVVLSIAEPLIDLAYARAFHPSIEHLCGATERERVAALAVASRRRPDRLHDVGREGNAVLHQLSQEVGRIANILASLSEEEAAALGARPPLRGSPQEEETIDPGFVRAIIRARRLREQFFRADLFADPAWDMLLDLMAARLEKNRVAVSSLCIAAAVPATTALRWIKTLTDQGLFVRSADPQDGRRVYIELSDDAARGMAAYLKALQRLSPSVI